MEVQEVVEERRGIVEETKWLEKSRGREDFLRLKGDSPDSLRGSTCLRQQKPWSCVPVGPQRRVAAGA